MSWVVFYYLVYTIANEVLMFFLKSTQFTDTNKDPLPVLYSVYTIVEFLLLGYYIYGSLENKRYKKALLIAGSVFLLLAFFNLYQVFFVEQRATLIDTIPVSTSALILIAFSIIYFFEEIQTPKVGFIYSTQNFWIVAGIMIYFSGTFFFFLQFSNLSNVDQDNFWIINLISIILKNIFFTIAFFLPVKAVNPDEEENPYKLENF